MRNLLLFVLLFGALCLSGCFSKQSSVTTNSYNSSSSPKPSATGNTAAVNPTTAAAADELKDVQYEQCRKYLTTLKTLTTCKSIPETERQKLSDIYIKTLAQTKTAYSDSQKTARDLMISVCEMSDKAMQPSLTKCN